MTKKKRISPGPAGKEMVSHTSATRISALVLTCFFFSGVTGLTYEILWTRMIVKVIGAAPFAVSIVLTVFMGGLGLGSYIAGRTIDRVKQPLRLVRIYGILELAIGAYGLAVPFLLRAFTPLYAIVYNQLFSHFMLYNFITFIGCAVLLCIPVICMGATLPILCRFYVTSLSHLGTHAGRLYGLNTIGAALGALLCGFWFIYYLGMPGTLILAVVINGVIGILCLQAGSKTQLIRQAEIPPQTDAVEISKVEQYPGALAGALIIFAVSGFCAMSYEVIWTKLLGLIVGPTTYSFTIVLVTFILGLALGSMLFGWLGDKTGKPLWLLVSTQIVAGLLALGISQVVGNSQFFFAKLIFTFRERFALLSITKAAVLFCFMIFPTLCLGATFPLVGKIYTQSVSRVGRSIGVAYAINTIGAVLGSFCAGFVLLPFFGKERSLSLVIGAQLVTSVVIAVIILSRKRRNLLKLAFLAAPALAGLILCFYFPMWNRHLLSRGKYHRFERIEEDIIGSGWLEALFRGSDILATAERGEVIYYGDGIGGFVTVLEYPGPFGDTERTLAISAKPDASSRGDMKTQTVCTHFPLLFHPNPKTVMVLGLASGVTAGEALYYPIEQLDVLEISEQVVEASDFFRQWNNNVLSNPRTNLIIQDARAHLQLTKQKYDVIISEPSNPWMAGLATLFTRDFFAHGKDRLNQGGIFVQFIHSYEMDWPSFSLVGRTFVDVFPNSLVFATEPAGFGDDYMLVGFKGSGELILENVSRRLKYAQQSRNVTLSDPRLLYRLIVSEDLRSLFGRGPINTDNWPMLEFAAPRQMHHTDPMVNRNLLSKRILRPTTIDIVQQLTVDVDSQIDFAAFALSVYAPFPKMVDLTKTTPAQEKRFFKLLDAYCASNSVNYSILKDEQLEKRCRSVQVEAIRNKIDVMPYKELSYFYLGDLYYAEDMMDEAVANYCKSVEVRPDFAEAQYQLALALERQGRIEEAIERYEQAVRIKPSFAMAHSHLAYALARQGRIDEAIKQFAKALRIKPDDAEAQSNLGGVLAKQGRFDEAVPHFVEALRIDPNFADAHNNLGYALALQGRFDEAIRHCTEALRIKPDFATAHSNLAFALIGQGKLDEAVEHYEKALQINPDFADAHRNLGYAFLQQGKLEGAVTHLREAVRIEPNVAKNHNDLGVALALQGNFDEAIACFTQALRIDPDYTDARRNLQRAFQRRSEVAEPGANLKSSE
jgi:spermidine synthase